MVHPRLTAHDLSGVLRQLVEGAALNGWVHGLLMALNLVLVTGFYGLSRRLGLGRPLVATAMIAYAFGALAMLAAAVVNGFALARFAGRYAELGADPIAGIGPSINAMGSMAAVWAAVGAVGGSAAIACWSARLLAFPGASRIVGALGLLLGAATVAMLVAGALVLDVHGFLLLVASQAAWTVAVGVQLVRGRL
jgi:hypothetical protein